MITKDKLIEVRKEYEVCESKAEQIERLKDYWNTKGISEIKTSKGFQQSARKSLSVYTVEEINALVDRYCIIYFDEDYFFNYKYVPMSFYTSQTLIKFDDGGSLWEGYLNYKEKSATKEKPKEVLKIEKPEIKKEKTEHEKAYNDLINSYKKMDYISEYLYTEHWEHFKKEVHKFYSNKCVVCCSTEKLSVHHNNYNNIGRETFNDVILVCGDCHRKIHGITGETHE